MNGLRFPAPEIYKVDKFYVNVNKLTVPKPGNES